MTSQKIPQATAKRILTYYRFMKNMAESGVQRVSSAELSAALRIDSATIRRDFSYFGALGRKGYGYDVAYLLEFFRTSLNQDTPTEVALVGVGNLGTAFVNYNFMKNNNTKILLGFDVDPDKVGRRISGVPIYSIDEMEQRLREAGIEMVILTVPSAVAQEIAERLVRAGIRAIMNFSPVPLAVPAHVHLHSIDLAVELQSLAYFMTNYPNSKVKEKENGLV